MKSMLMLIPVLLVLFPVEAKSQTCRMEGQLPTPMSEWNSTYLGSDTYCDSPNPISPNWKNTDVAGLEAYGVEYQDLYWDTGETDTEALLDLAQALVGSGVTEVTYLDFDPDVSEHDVWLGANIFNTPLTDYKLTLGTSNERESRIYPTNSSIHQHLDTDETGPYLNVKGGIEYDVKVYSRNGSGSGTLDWYHDADNQCTTPAVIDSGDIEGDYPHEVEAPYIVPIYKKPSWKQGERFQIRANARWGELNVYHGEVCDRGPGGASYYDVANIFVDNVFWSSGLPDLVQFNNNYFYSSQYASQLQGGSTLQVDGTSSYLVSVIDDSGSDNFEIFERINGNWVELTSSPVGSYMVSFYGSTDYIVVTTDNKLAYFTIDNGSGWKAGNTGEESDLQGLEEDLILTNAEAPTTFSLLPNYPNPFNPTTQISYQLPEDAEVMLTIYDMMGREVERLVDQYQQAGTYTVNWDAHDLPSGKYAYQIQAGDFFAAKIMTLLK